MKILIGLFVLLLSGYITMPTTSQAVTLEFRPGSQSLMKGLTEMTVVGTDQKVYISQDVVARIFHKSVHCCHGIKLNCKSANLSFSANGFRKFSAKKYLIFSENSLE